MLSHYKSKYRSEKKYKLVDDIPEDYHIEFLKNHKNIQHIFKQKDDKKPSYFGNSYPEDCFPSNSEPSSPEKNKKKIKFIRFQRNLHSSIKNT